MECIDTARTYALMLRCRNLLHAILPHSIQAWAARLVSLAGRKHGLLGMRTGEEDGDVVVKSAVHKALPPSALPQALDGLTCHIGNAFQGENQKLVGSLPVFLHSTK